VQDYDAWTSSMEHIRATPGYPDGSWPREMTRDENRADLQRHANDFRTRKGFTYTVLDPTSRDVIGCVYIYPLPDSNYDACALSWVRESQAHLDTPLWRAVSKWLQSDWPFASVQYSPSGVLVRRRKPTRPRRWPLGRLRARRCPRRPCPRRGCGPSHGRRTRSGIASSPHSLCPGYVTTQPMMNTATIAESRGASVSRTKAIPSSIAYSTPSAAVLLNSS